MVIFCILFFLWQEVKTQECMNMLNYWQKKNVLKLLDFKRKGEKATMFQKPQRAEREIKEWKMRIVNVLCFILTCIPVSSLSDNTEKAEKQLHHCEKA